MSKKQYKGQSSRRVAHQHRRGEKAVESSGLPAHLSWIFGIHAAQGVLSHKPDQVIEIYLADQQNNPRLAALEEMAQTLGLTYCHLSMAELDEKLGADKSHQGVALVCKAPRPYAFDDLAKLMAASTRPLFLVLDAVTDPHNLGACLRTAEATGVTAVIAPKDKSASLNSTVQKVACGAAQFIPFVQVTNLARTLGWLQQEGVWVVGTAGESEISLYKLDLSGPIAFVMGAEGKGMRRLTREACDYLVSLPMAGQVSSLNVSVATGVCLFEAVRQRQSMTCN